MPTLTQHNRFIAIETPLGPDALGLVAFTGHEELGRLSQFEVELISDNFKINFDDLIGQKVSIRLETTKGQPRYFHGYISRFTQLASRRSFARYHATIVPWLWLLTRRSDCCIFQDKTIPQVLQEVFKRCGVAEFELRLSGSYSPVKYCVQYRETDFNFVSRLMEQEGIYYFFRHEKAKHTLVLADSPSAHSPNPGYEEIAFRPEAAHSQDSENILDWMAGKELQPGAYAHTDFNFETPSKKLLSQSKIKRKYGFADLEIFDYPGDYGESADGDRHAKVRIQELQAHYETLEGEADARGICVGSTFTLKDHPRSDQVRKYLVKSTHHSAQAGEFESDTGGGGASGPAYHCSFTAFDAAETFRPERTTPKPMVHGVQTAKVVGPSGETIHTDNFGRVKVQFHWDRHAKGDDSSSCWIRASQPWGGGNWGGMFIPHVGQEVIIGFEEGDPDRPIITGRIYNADQMPPLPLPANKTKSMIRDHGGNHIRMEGEKGSEQIHLYTPFAESKISIGAPNQSPGVYITTKAHALWDVAQNYIEKVKGSKTITTEGDSLYTLGGNWNLRVDKATDAIFKGAYRELYSGEVNIKYEKPKIAIHGGASSDTFIGLKHGTFIGLEFKLNYSKSWERGYAKTKKKVDGEVLIDSKTETKIVGGGGDAEYCQMKLDSSEAVVKCGDSKITIEKDGVIHIEGKGDIILESHGEIALSSASGKPMTFKADKVEVNGAIHHKYIETTP